MTFKTGQPKGWASDGEQASVWDKHHKWWTPDGDQTSVWEKQAKAWTPNQRTSFSLGETP